VFLTTDPAQAHPPPLIKFNELFRHRLRLPELPHWGIWVVRTIWAAERRARPVQRGG
jgi:hypothetical protein